MKLREIKRIKRYGRFVTLFLLISFVIAACSKQNMQPDVQIQPADTGTVQEEPAQTSTAEEQEGMKTQQEEARFTIEAIGINREAIGALYAAFFEGEQPVFVESGADLQIVANLPEYGKHPEVPAMFLSGQYLLAHSDAAEISDFIRFSTSLEGQQVLIDEGFLPSSIQIVDQAGNTVELQQPITKIISSYGPSTAFVYAVGAKDRLVSASYLGARDPSGAGFMKKIDSRFEEIMGDDEFSQDSFNVEGAASLEPDLVLTSARTGWLDVLEQINLPAVLYDAETPERLKEAMALTGQLFGPQTTAQANTWIAYYDETISLINTLTTQIPEEDRPRVLFTGTSPLRVSSGEMYQTKIIEFAGGISVSAGLSGYWNDINIEQVALWNPDVIIVPPYGGATVEAITESEEWQILDAVQAGRVYQMPKVVVPWDTPAPDSILGIVWLTEKLHPDLAIVNCAEETDYFYRTFYDYEITDDEIITVCKID